MNGKIRCDGEPCQIIQKGGSEYDSIALFIVLGSRFHEDDTDREPNQTQSDSNMGSNFFKNLFNKNYKKVKVKNGSKPHFAKSDLKLEFKLNSSNIKLKIRTDEYRVRQRTAH